MHARRLVGIAIIVTGALGAAVAAEVRLSPPGGTTLAVGQRFDVRAGAPGAGEVRWAVTLDGTPLAATESGPGPFFHRDATLERAGRHLLRAEARAADGSLVGVAESAVEAIEWRGRGHARNVILLIGDGMGHGHRTAARIFLHGLEGGKPGGRLAMETLPVAGMLATSSASGLVTDSAAAGHALATGTKTANLMLGVLPDETPDRSDDNPRVEQLPSLVARTHGMVTGIVTTAEVTDATPSAFVTHTANRHDSAVSTAAFAEAARAGYLRVLLGGGARHFETELGRTHLAAFTTARFAEARTAVQLAGVHKAGAPRVLGLFHSGHMSTEYDRQRRGDPGVVKEETDQPSLEAMTRAALAALAPHPGGFFLMVEGAHIDRQSHIGDQERMVWEVLAFDRAVMAALEFARGTNEDRVEDNDTLVIVTADHETGGVVLPGLVASDCLGSRDCLQVYDAAGFPVAADANHDGFPDSADPARKVAIHFGAAPDRYEDWRSQPRPVPMALGRAKRDRLVLPNPERDGGTGVLLGGVLPVTLTEHGYAPHQAVHTAADVPLSAYGPGAEALAGLHDNTEVLPAILRALGSRREGAPHP